MNQISQDFENSDESGSASDSMNAEGTLETSGDEVSSEISLESLIAKYANEAIEPAIIASFVDSCLKAFSQYCIEATAEETLNDEGLKGDFSSRITLTDKEHGSQVAIGLLFPKSVAGQIYQNIFGDVEMENVKGVVHELGNILAGLAKVQITNLHSDIFQLVHPESAEENVILNFQTGLPENDNFTEKDLAGIPKFAVSLNLGFGNIILRVSFHTV